MTSANPAVPCIEGRCSAPIAPSIALLSGACRVADAAPQPGGTTCVDSVSQDSTDAKAGSEGKAPPASKPPEKRCTLWIFARSTRLA